MEKIICNDTTLCLDEATLLYSFQMGKSSWCWDKNYVPKLETSHGTILFSDAKKITHSKWETGLGLGILSRYEDFSFPLSFETIVWVESSCGRIHFEWIPLSEESMDITAVLWPGYMDFSEKKDSWYTLLNLEQGLLIPNTWETELGTLMFGGQMCTAAAYMPWFSQIKDRMGYLAVCEQPWDACYYAEHPAHGPYTHVGIKWIPSLGQMSYRRSIIYTFLADCSYNEICKCYRSYVQETGLFCSLSEKAARVPGVDQLIGSSFLHRGIKTQVMEDSNFFDPNAPHKNNRLVPFHTRTEEIRHFHELGFQKLYLHLDGWADPGYDNQHPDYMPACLDAGGWEGMKELSDTMKECGYLFGIHDQYRDYYFAAKTFNRESACHNMDGSIPEHANWAGGHQTYLCATQAPGYVKRNFSQLESHHIHLDGAYLDVFTCNEPDECNHPRHRMTRKDCLDYRNRCFQYLLSRNILTSSEEVTDWSMQNLVFCHYAPYSFMMAKPGTPKKGLAVPLFNLVYHDCLIVPWMMDKVSETEDYMLYALLNGGAPYFIRDGAYANTDGSFDTAFTFTEREAYERCAIVASLHEKIAKSEMISHEFVNGNPSIQQTTFRNGYRVLINTEAQTYQIDKN
ncbi:MAG: DUF5696 domain-containing protein [Lachnospiraceae bacterium]